MIVVVLPAFLRMGGGKTYNMTAAEYMTAAEFNTALTGNLANQNSGDTIIVKGDVSSVLANPLLTGSSFVSLGGTTLLISVTLPSSCTVGTHFTMTLHVNVITYGGQSGKWFKELGNDPTPTAVTVPASAISCVAQVRPHALPPRAGHETHPFRDEPVEGKDSRSPAAIATAPLGSEFSTGQDLWSPRRGEGEWCMPKPPIPLDNKKIAFI